mgnify:CR=1 FL=1
MNKILVLANDSGGLYHFRRELLEKLLKTNQVIVSVPKTNEFINLKEMGCEMIVTDIDRRGINPFRDFKLLLFYHKIIKNIQPDLVITYTIKPNIYGGMVCRKYKLNYAENVTGLGTAFQKENLLKKIVIGMYRFSMKSVKKVFFENLTNRNIFIENHIVSYDKTVVLNGAGVNLDYFTYHEYPKETSKIKFLFIGRVMKEKGVDELLEATEKIWEINKNILLEIVGRSEEDYTSKMKKGIANGWLVYHGFQKDVKPFIINTNCFILPSWHEGMANTNLESSAVGRPIITSNIPGCREALIDGKTGFLCEAHNVESVCNAMNKFIQLPYEDKKKMGIEARKHMKNKFDKKKVVDETIRNLY